MGRVTAPYGRAVTAVLGPDEPFVGRARERAQLEALLTAALAGRSALALIGGPAGIGKTRLAQELADAATLRGVSVLWATCAAPGGAPPFWPWAQVMRACSQELDRAGLTRLMGGGARYLAQAFPELADALPQPPEPVGLVDAHARFALCDATLRFMEGAAAIRPRLLVFDDLHAADPSTHLLLRFVAAGLRGAPVLLVATYRDPDDRAQAWPLAELARDAHRIVLRALGDSEVAGYVTAVLGEAAGDEAAQVQSLARGNALFVRELVRLLRTGEAATLQAGLGGIPIPAAIGAAVRERWDGLPAGTRAALAAAAVMGQTVDTALLAEVTGQTEPDTLDALGAAVRDGLLTHDPADPLRLSFAHPLYREVPYQDLAPADRADLHRRAAAAFGRRLTAGIDIDEGQVAHHLLASGLPELLDDAVDHAVTAARQRAARLAYEDAVVYYVRVLDALKRSVDPDPDRQGALLVGLAEARRRAGEADAAAEDYLSAAALARRTGNAELLAAAAIGLEDTRWRGTGTRTLPTAIMLLEEALTRVGPDHPALRATLLGRLVRAAHLRDPAQIGPLADEAMTLASRTNDPTARAAALEGRRFALWRGGSETVTRQRLAASTALERLGHEIGDPELALRGHLWRLYELVELGQWAAVDTGVDRYAQMAGRLHQPSYVWLIPAMRSMRALRLGRWDQAENLLADAVDAAATVGDDMVHNVARAQALVRAADTGRLDLFDPGPRGAAPVGGVEPLMRATRALVSAATGSPDTARAILRRLAADDCAAIRPSALWAWTMAVMAEACWQADAGDVAPVLYRQLQPRTGTVVMLLGPAAYWRAADDFLGLLALTAGWDDQAVAHLRAAQDCHDRAGALPWSAANRVALAGVLARRDRAGDRSMAVQLLAEADAVARRLDSRPLRDRSAAVHAGLDFGAARHRRATDPRSEALGPPPDSGRPSETVGPPARFVREGGLWTLEFAGFSVLIDDLRGLHYLRELLARPDTERPAHELAGDGVPASTAQRERARLNVTRAIRSALQRITEHHPLLGQHLRACVRTGQTCVYSPDPAAPPMWRLR